MLTSQDLGGAAKVKAGDLLPGVAATLVDTTGNAVDLTTATSVLFVMRAQTTTTPAVSSAATIVNASAGQVSYAWQPGDTSVSGRYDVEFVVTFPGGTLTLPQDGYFTVTIEETLSSTTDPSRIVSLEDIKAHLRIPLNRTTDDVALLGFLDAAQQLVENITGPVAPRTYTETFDGGTDMLLLSHYPVRMNPTTGLPDISSVTEVRGTTIYNVTYQPLGGPVADGFGYTFDYLSNRLVRRIYGAASAQFGPGNDNVTVTYTCGRSPVPPTLRLAVLELVRHLWQQGQDAVSPFNAFAPGGDEVEQPASIGAAFAVPNRVIELCQPYRRPPAIG